MKHAVRNFTTSAVLIILLFMPVMKAVGQSQETASPADAMSFWQARRAIIAASRYAGVNLPASANHYYPINPSSIRLTVDSVEFDGTSKKGDTQHFKVALKDLGRIEASCSSPVGCSVHGKGFRIHHVETNGTRKTEFWFGWDGAAFIREKCRVQNVDDCLHAADRFAAALNGLRAFAASRPPDAEDAHKQAAVWRAQAAKPPLPEEIRVQRMLAEDAIKNHRPNEALNYYELALQRYATWPAGRFNAALISGELGYYTDAVEHMQAYLELVPDASDAQSVRDQVAMWQYKAKTVPAANPDKARER